MLERYRLPLAPVPEVIALALSQDVQHAEFPQATAANTILDNWEAMRNKVFRCASGKVLVTCETCMPDVSPAMIDWWFGWHLPDTDRYRLWHPEAHQKARVKDDRSDLPDSRDRYIGNTSFVDEYIGKTLNRLAITFLEPAQLGLGDVYRNGTTAICGITADRRMNTEVGHLVHYMAITNDGCVMRSLFWLGEFTSHVPIVGGVLSRVTNIPFVRRKLVTDQMAFDLFQHCSEEMNHLVKFLPTLYRDQQQAQK